MKEAEHALARAAINLRSKPLLLGDGPYAVNNAQGPNSQAATRAERGDSPLAYALVRNPSPNGAILLACL